MGKGLNRVDVIGHLAFDPKMHRTDGGTVIANLVIPVDEVWKDRQTGEEMQKTEWFRIKAFNKLAEVCEQHLKKGSRCMFTGKLESRKYTDKEGIERVSIEVLAHDLLMLSSKGSTDNSEQPAANNEVPAIVGDAPGGDPFLDKIPFSPIDWRAS